MVEYFNSSRGNPKLAFEGYIYNSESTGANGSRIWRCEERRKHKCKSYGRMIDEVFRLQKGHTHEPNIDGTRARIHKSIIYENACSGTSMKDTIAATEQLPEVILANLPNVKSLRRNIMKRRKRQQMNADAGTNSDPPTSYAKLNEFGTTAIQYSSVDDSAGQEYMAGTEWESDPHETDPQFMEQSSGVVENAGETPSKIPKASAAPTQKFPIQHLVSMHVNDQNEDVFRMNLVPKNGDKDEKEAQQKLIKLIFESEYFDQIVFKKVR